MNYLIYIDPGIGSLAVQAIIAGLLAGWVFFKNSIRKILFRPVSKDKQEDNERKE